jgi:uncharacterized protein
MYVLPGNHESLHDIEMMCSRFGLSNFHGATLSIGETTIAGLGYSNPTPFNTPGEYSEAELEERLQPFAGVAPLVMICHCPPLGTALDRIREGVHAGSSAMLKFIETTQPRYFFCGHIHEAEGVTVQIGNDHRDERGKERFSSRTLSATSSARSIPCARERPDPCGPSL